MKHGWSCPHMCSQCAGAVAKRVRLDGPSVTVDGEPVEREDKKRRDYFVRGGKRRRTRK